MEPDFHKERRTILVSGAGIAGLASALFIARAGYRVEIFEQAPKIDPIGSGLQLSPNAMQVLAALGLEQQIKSVATAPSAIDIRSGRSARKITQIPLGVPVIEKYGQPYLVIHRADLQNILLSACQHEADIELHQGVLVRDAVAHPNGITLIGDNKNGTTNYRGVALIGADGVNSTIRTECFDCKGAVSTGTVALRALISRDKLPGNLPTDKICMWLAPNAHAVVYPLRGETYYNVVLTVPDKFANDVAAISILPGNSALSGNDIAAKLEHWHDDFTQLLKLDTEWTKWPLLAAPKLQKWNEGNIVLVGDAAHAMTPHAAQGAAQGLEDAAVLGWAVKSEQALDKAFQLYQNQRMKRAEAVRRLSQTNKMIYQLPTQLALFRNLAMWAMGGQRILNRQEWIYRWRVPTVIRK